MYQLSNILVFVCSNAPEYLALLAVKLLNEYVKYVYFLF